MIFQNFRKKRETRNTHQLILYHNSFANEFITHASEKITIQGTPTHAQFIKIRLCKSLLIDCSTSSKTFALPDYICQLTNLENLMITGDYISSISSCIYKLSNLRKLIIFDCSIHELPESIGNLPQLEELRIHDTPISSLPDTIGHLSSLKTLILSCTKISLLPTSISNLTKLYYFDLSKSDIKELPDWIGELPNLQYLNLSHMILSAIPRSLSLLGFDFYEKDNFIIEEPGINLYKTILINQNKFIFLNSPHLIPSLYESDELNTIHECRVLFLGDGEAGKSYTIQRFRNEGRKETNTNPYITHETPGVEILDYHVKHDTNNFDIHFWDFGGQQLLHSMHRCFLTEDTCYVVMVKTRETKANERARYWLRNVSVFAPNSPVILFVNCWEDDDGQRSIDEPKLLLDFPNIQKIVYCSAKEASEKEFREQVMDSIIQLAISSVGISKQVPHSWLVIRRAIEEESKDSNYLTSYRYHELCETNNIKNEQIPELLSFFNSLGVCFSYHLNQSKEKFFDYKLLNPTWLTNGIYAIIKEGRVYAEEGFINESAIWQMLGNNAPKIIEGKEYRRTVPEIVYQSYECGYLLAVAEAFELCYYLDAHRLFFPSLCSRNTPKDALTPLIDYSNKVVYQLKYIYLPDNVIHKLIIRCHRRELVISSCWQRGMIISWKTTHRAIIYMEDDDTVLSINVFSKPDQPAYDLFQIIREEILDINTVLNLTATENIIDGKDTYSITALISAAKDSDKVYGSTTGKLEYASKLLGRFYDEWTIKMITVQDRTITIPLLPMEYHPCSPQDDALRQALYEVYHRTCAYCGNRIASLREMQIEHIFPKHYKVQEDLQVYIDYLNAKGFNTEKPDYVENYLPVHGPCNLDKSNYVELFALLARHEKAAKNASRVLKLKEKYEVKETADTK